MKINTTGKESCGAVAVKVDGEREELVISKLVDGIYECDILQDNHDGTCLIEVPMLQWPLNRVIYHVPKTDLLD